MEQKTLTMSPVGQITIPLKIRKLLDLQPGTKFNFEINQETRSITLKKQKSFDEVMSVLDEIDRKYNITPPASQSTPQTAGEISLEQTKHIKGDTWV